MSTSIIAHGQVMPVPRRRFRMTNQMREEIGGLIWTSPWWAGVLVFSIYPMIAGLYYSFNKATLTGLTEWVGLQNYIRVFTKDPLFWPSVWRMFYYAIVSVPLTMGASLLAASVLNQRIAGQNIFRTIFYIPTLMPTVGLVVIWAWILNPKVGLLNWFLSLFGIHGPTWLMSPTWAMPSLFIMAAWGAFGGNAMIIFLSSMQSVPQELYEACEIDGGKAWAKFWNVTVPMIAPAIVFNWILGIMGAMQSFLYQFLAPEPKGGPNYATYTLGLHMYVRGFEYGEMGYASALAWAMFVLVFGLVVVNYKFSGQWSPIGSEG